ncbi:histidine phosphatase family protein [Paenibacillus sp. NPDC056579]|uniref:histidine phosphatase family protein n=1 Tax=unclassified Paenibacillus TaxID=185978 RepID=UPI001EF95695|nr:histidine phosphatase family protein [Paenibacillus sp. H1-7]ULL15435.1 histidine phosphatase family protein [Paenibacillus sp. H1-7]
MITTLYLTRHGETEWNVEKRLQGHKDSSLTPRGVLQAAWLGEMLYPVSFHCIYSSSSERARRTAEIIRGKKTAPVLICDQLREIHMGDWEGMTGSRIQDRVPDEYYSFWNTPHLYQPTNGGETFFELYDRVVPWLNGKLSEHQGQCLLIVTHAITLKLIMGCLQSRPLNELWAPPLLPPASLCKVVIEDGDVKVMLYGDTSHFREIKM